MFREQKNFTDPIEFLSYFINWNNDLDGFIFRGHSNDEWELKPLALRKAEREKVIQWAKTNPLSSGHENTEFYQVQREYYLLRDFYKMADKQGLRVPSSVHFRRNLAAHIDIDSFRFFDGGTVWIPLELHEVAGLAQHYGMPTRLLDWTYDPFIALHFALKGAIGKTGNLCIWCMNQKTLSSPLFPRKKNNIKFITPPYFDNPNLNAQKGLFTHIQIRVEAPGPDSVGTQVDIRPLDEIIKDEINDHPEINDLFLKVTLPCSMAKQAYLLLSNHGYGAAKIFPGYDGIAQQIKDDELLR